MQPNEVKYFGKNILSLKDDDVTEEDVRRGVKFHKPDGSPAVGTMDGGGTTQFIEAKFEDASGGKIVCDTPFDTLKDFYPDIRGYYKGQEYYVYDYVITAEKDTIILTANGQTILQKISYDDTDTVEYSEVDVEAGGESILEQAKKYADTGDAKTLQTANTNIANAKQQAIETAETHADTVAAAAEESAKDYALNAADSAEQAAKTHANTVAAQAAADAELYTDNKLKNYNTASEISQKISETIATLKEWVTNQKYAKASQFDSYRTAEAQNVIDNEIKLDITNIKAILPAEATSENQLADKAFVVSEIQKVAETFLTYDAEGNNFPSYNSLITATKFYDSGTLVTPKKNDYCVVVNDEEHEGKQAQYICTKVEGITYTWKLLYTIEFALTEAQKKALNSGITTEGVSQIDTNKNDIAEHNQRITTNSTSISALSQNVVDLDNAIKANTQKILTNTQNIATNAENILANSQKISSNTQNITKNTGNIETNKTDINALKEKTDTTNTNLSNLAGVVQELSTELGETTTTANQAAAGVAGHDTRIEALEKIANSFIVECDFDTEGNPVIDKTLAEINEAFAEDKRIYAIYRAENFIMRLAYCQTEAIMFMGMLGLEVMTLIIAKVEEQEVVRFQRITIPEEMPRAGLGIYDSYAETGETYLNATLITSIVGDETGYTSTIPYGEIASRYGVGVLCIAQYDGYNLTAIGEKTVEEKGAGILFEGIKDFEYVSLVIGSNEEGVDFVEVYEKKMLQKQLIAGRYMEIAEDGTINCTLENAIPIQIETEAEMDAQLTFDNIGKCFKYVGTTTDKYVQGDIYEVEEKNNDRNEKEK